MLQAIRDKTGDSQSRHTIKHKMNSIGTIHMRLATLWGHCSPHELHALSNTEAQWCIIKCCHGNSTERAKT